MQFDTENAYTIALFVFACCLAFPIIVVVFKWLVFPWTFQKEMRKTRESIDRMAG